MTEPDRRPDRGELIARNVDVLAAMPDVEAVGLAGSYAIGQHDDYSDLDFVVVVAGGAEAIVDQFADRIRARLQPLSIRYIGHWRGFGFCYSLITRNGELVEYFVNDVEALPRTGMTRKTRLLFDRTGRATEWSEQSQADRAEFVADRDGPESAADFLAELHALRRFAARQDFLRYFHHLDALRSVMVAYARAVGRDERYVTYGGDRDVRSVLGAEFEDFVLGTIPWPDATDLPRATKAICARFLSDLDQTLDGSAWLATVQEIAARLLAEIGKHLRRE